MPDFPPLKNADSGKADGRGRVPEWHSARTECHPIRGSWLKIANHFGDFSPKQADLQNIFDGGGDGFEVIRKSGHCGQILLVGSRT